MVISFGVSAQEIPRDQKNLLQFTGKWKCTDFSFILQNKKYSGEYTFDCLPVNMNTGKGQPARFLY
jgi:hypothetical protein